jgi:hypothetical protein
VSAVGFLSELAVFFLGEVGAGDRAVQRSLPKVIEKIVLGPPKAAARRSCGIVSV